MSKKSKNTLTLSQKHEVIKLSDTGKSSRQLADAFGCGRSQIQNILKRKREVLDDIANNAPLDKKRKVKESVNDPINDLTLKWLLDAFERRFEVNGPMLQKQALKFAADLGITTFSASNGWKDAFLKRNNIKFGKLSGEGGDVDLDVVAEWKERLPSILEGYLPRDILNLDETGLLFKTTQPKTFYQKDKKCAGGKKSKERLTLLLCCNLCGDKEKAVIVGKSCRPRAFKSKDVRTFPCTYKFSKKAWMTTAIFTAWLTAFNDDMKRQNRHVLLFLDNAPCHPNLTMSNVKLSFSPQTLN